MKEDRLSGSFKEKSRTSTTKNSFFESKSHIEYDDDNDSSSEFRTSKKSSEKPSKLIKSNIVEQFESDNPDYKNVHIKTLIGDDDEISLLQIPSSVDPNLLLNTSISFNDKTKLKLDGCRYVSEPSTKKSENLLILHKKLQLFHPVSNLIVRKKLSDKVNSNLSFSEQNKVPLPNNLKLRHPLFGPEYETMLILDEETKQKLNGAVFNNISKSKKKKKKDKICEKPIKQEVDDSLSKNDVIMSLLENFDKKRKKNRSSNEILKSPKKEHSYINSTVLSDLKTPSFELDISNITTDNTVQLNGIAKKSKKDEKTKKRKLSDGNDVGTFKKKNKQEKNVKKEDSEDEKDVLIMDILNSVRERLDSSSSNSKKQKKSLL